MSPERPDVIMARFMCKSGYWEGKKRRAKTRHGWLPPVYGRPKRVRVRK
jgi:hypothetical protein